MASLTYIIPTKPIRKTATKLLLGSLILLLGVHGLIFIMQISFAPIAEGSALHSLARFAPKLVILGIDAAAFLFLTSFVSKPVLVEKKSEKELTYKAFRFWGLTLLLIGLFSFAFIETISLIGILSGYNAYTTNIQFGEVLRVLMMIGLITIPVSLITLLFSLFTEGKPYQLASK